MCARQTADVGPGFHPAAGFLAGVLRAATPGGGQPDAGQKPGGRMKSWPHIAKPGAAMLAERGALLYIQGLYILRLCSMAMNRRERRIYAPEIDNTQ